MMASPPTKVINIKLQQDVQLHTAENACKPSRNADKTEELCKKVKGILNKLTAQTFDKFYQQIMDLDINTEERLKVVVKIIFEKAISEPRFSNAYAQLSRLMLAATLAHVLELYCMWMISMKISFASLIKVPQDANKNNSVVFRILLLNLCQREFEKHMRSELDLTQREKEIDDASGERNNELKEAKELAEHRAKRRALGNIRFIGELFNLKVLTENIMHDCFVKLLRSSDEDKLECFCCLLITTGKYIDNLNAKPRVDQYFAHMEKIVRMKKTSVRVRFIVQDVLELRKNKWVPRQEDGVKTEQIQQELQERSAQKQMLLKRVSQEQECGGGSSQSILPSNSCSGGYSDDGQSAITKSSCNTPDQSRMKPTTQNVLGADNIGVSGFSGRDHGESDGSIMHSASQEQERASPNTPNRNSGNVVCFKVNEDTISCSSTLAVNIPSLQEAVPDQTSIDADVQEPGKITMQTCHIKEDNSHQNMPGKDISKNIKGCDGVSSFVHCPICLDPCTDARVLVCQHSFCLKCLRDHVTSTHKNNTFSCPVCRETCSIPEGGIDSQEENVFLNNLSSYLEKKESVNTSQLICSLEQCSEKATHVCVDGCDFLCQTCHIFHGRARASKHHAVINVDELDSTKIENKLKTMSIPACETHPPCPLDFYCQKCMCLLCGTCFFLEHQGHTCINLSDQPEQMKAEFQKLIKKTKHCLDSVKQAAEATQKEKGTTEKDFDNLENQVMCTIQKLHEYIEKIKNNFIMQLQQVKSEVSKKKKVPTATLR